VNASPTPICRPEFAVEKTFTARRRPATIPTQFAGGQAAVLPVRATKMSQDRTRFAWRTTAAVAVWLFAATILPGGLQAAAAGEAIVTDAVPVAIRVTWGGGKQRRWAGRITLGGPATIVRCRSLSPDPDANAGFHLADGGVVIHQPSARSFDGVDLMLDRGDGGRIVVELEADGRSKERTTLDLAIDDVLASSRQQPLDQDGNRLVVRRVPGDAIQVAFRPFREAAVGDKALAGPLSGAAVACLRRPGEIVRLWVRPLIDGKSAKAGDYELRLRLLGGGKQLFTAAIPLAPTDSVGSKPAIRGFAEVPVEVPLPTREGAYDLELDVLERGSLRWSRAVASRTVQFAAVASSSTVASGERMQVVYELDPGSPRLLDRLRRLPGVAVPALNVPQLPIPQIGITQIPKPGVGSMPRLPGVDALMPRGGGLVAAGDSTVEPHPLGPVLKLPAAGPSGSPAWEGVAIPVARPGIPHVIELEYPSDQDATVALAVIEPNASGEGVAISTEGGFRVKRPAFGVEPARMEVHRLVFWPKTRLPVVVFANPSPVRAAVVGRLRVLAGPDRLPSQDRTAGSPGTTAPGRQVHGYLAKPDFSRFSGIDAVDPESGRPIHDWAAALAGITRCAEQLKAQAADGAMVAFYADGAAAWPSQLGVGGTRWDGGAFAERGADLEPKDLVALATRVFERERLGLIAAIECSGPLASLEAALANGSADVAGIECVGRDGRPAPSAPGRQERRYNILDPRVQDAVVGLVSDLAMRLGDSPAVAGLAVILGHDGWMHLPGVAWGLDDTTMDSFGREARIDVPRDGDDRFARRAALVEGPSRAAWLDWRAGRIAELHARLADVVASRRPGLDLHVVMTTLLSEGPVAARFRPMLGAAAPESGVLLDLGIDPARIAAHPRIVFVSPQQRIAGEDIVAEGTIERTVRSLAVVKELSRVPRRGAVLLDRTLEVDLRKAGRLLGGGASTGAMAAVKLHAPPTGPDRSRGIAESLLPADCERLFDESLLIDLAPEPMAERLRVFASLPAATMETASGLPAPIVARTIREGDRLSVCLVNASAAACTARLTPEKPWASLVDSVRGGPVVASIPASGSRETRRPTWQVSLGPWEVRSLDATGQGEVVSVGVVHDEAVRKVVEERLASLRRRRASLEMPPALESLDNPAFELPSAGGAVPGWELVEAGRGAIDVVPSGASGSPQAIRFASEHGLATLQSNAFAAPRTGRVSVAAWLKLDDDGGQPPLRIAVEGREGGRQYYRFATVGVGAGSMPLKSDWAQVVLQIDDLPTSGMESLRVRFDLLGPGRVRIDEVRVFDLAFEESQRVQLSKALALIDHHLASGDLGACLVELDGHWPRFLMELVPEKGAEPVLSRKDSQESERQKGSDKASEIRSSMIEKMRRFWQ